MLEYLSYAGYILAAIALIAAVAPVLFDAYFLPRVKPEPSKVKESRLGRLGDAISQVLNVIIFNGNQNHSISGDAFRYGRARTLAVSNFLFRSDDHCRLAHLKDVWNADRLISQTPSHLIVEARQIFGRETG